MKNKITVISILLMFSFNLGVSQNLNVNYINPSFLSSNYNFLRLGNENDYFAGFMYNFTSGEYGDGNDFSIFTYANRDLTIRTGTGNFIVFPNPGASGNMGIGTNFPTEKLHIVGGLRLRKALLGSVTGSAGNSWLRDSWLTSNYGIEWDEGSNLWKRGSYTYNDFGGIVWQDEGTYFLREPSGSKLEFTNQEFLNSAFMFAHIHTGNIGIGTTTPDSKLTVAGKIHAQEIKVTTTAGADFVFEADYPLRSLEETEQFIKENKHLPGIPSAEEMVEEGITLGEMNVKLLQKIEELTLYVIDLQGQVNELKNRK